MRAEAVLFDVDGTLLNTWDFILQAFKHSLLSNGYGNFSNEAITPVIGLSLVECYQLLAPGGNIDELVISHKAFQEDKFELVQPYPNVIQTLEELRSRGFVTAAVTNRTHDSLMRSLELAKMVPLFDVILSGEKVANPKPHPEHLLVALRSLKTQPNNAYMVGDTGHDIVAGKAAGTRTIGVTYGFDGQNILTHQPDHIIQDFRELLPIVR